MKSKPCIALLRGINVGRAKRVAMADLRRLLESLGFGAVSSVLNSGNLVFDAGACTTAAAAGAIEQAMLLELGLAARVLVLDSDELAAVIEDNPLVARATDHARLLAFVLAEPGLGRRVEALCAQDWSPGALALGRRAAYVWCPDGVLQSAAAARVGKELGEATTSRNWSTMCKLHALCSGAGAGRPPATSL